MSSQVARYAYFSMEIGLESSLPTYAGGLGVLAGDALRAAADRGLPLVAVSLCHRSGYFGQRLGADGSQYEDPMPWEPSTKAERSTVEVEIVIEGRAVLVGAWLYRIKSQHGGIIPVYLLDADHPKNSIFDRSLTGTLYGGDARYRLCQELLLGEGGVKMLRALGFHGIARFHLNEGHAALAIPTLMEEYQLEASHRGSHGALQQQCSGDPLALQHDRMLAWARRHCVFTTHTPVEAGHDKFPRALATAVLGEHRWALLQKLGQQETLNMTEVALHGSHFVNGVAMRHGQISRRMFPGYPIHSITNGIHAQTWAANPFQSLFDRYLPGWRQDSFNLRYAISIPHQDLRAAHQQCKQQLIEYVHAIKGVKLRENTLLLGFARRATAYKRALLLFKDIPRLTALAKRYDGVSIVMGGKAHPHDHEGKAIIRSIHEAAQQLHNDITVVYLENYDMDACRQLVAGCDVWLNTPRPPLEASGTSGMKAALNGVPSLSVLDGWWVEGCVEGVTGWAVGHDLGASFSSNSDTDAIDADSLYTKLEAEVLPLYYANYEKFLECMRSAIALNGSFFNAERMLAQYLHHAYRPSELRDLRMAL